MDAAISPRRSVLLSRADALFIGIACLAGASRILNLGLAPLNDAEAEQAFAALQRNGLYFNPLLAAFQSWLFSIFGASDIAARLPNAIAGALLCLLPMWLMSPVIGRARAIIFSLLLLFSPALWLLSRQADGTVLAWTLMLAAWVLLSRASSIWQMTLAALCVGLLVACGRDAVTPLIALVTLWLVAAPAATAILTAEPKQRERLLIVAAVAWLIGSSGALFALNGIGATFGGFAEWWRALGAPNAELLRRAFVGLFANEILIVLCAVVAVVGLAFRRALNEDIAWLALIAVGFVALVFSRQPSVAQLAPIVIGAAAIASRAIVALYETLARATSAIRQQLSLSHLYLVALLIGFAAISLAQYAAQAQVIWLISMLVSVLMLLGVTMMISAWQDIFTSLRVVLAGVLIGVCVYTLSVGYRMNFVNVSNAAEPYRLSPPTRDLQLLSTQVHQIGLRGYGDTRALALRVDDSAPPSLRWALRDQTKLSYGSLSADTVALLAPLRAAQPQSAQPYIGDVFSVSESHALANIGCRSTASIPDCATFVKWLLYRQAPEGINANQWVLWLRQDAAVISSGTK